MRTGNFFIYVNKLFDLFLDKCLYTLIIIFFHWHTIFQSIQTRFSVVTNPKIFTQFGLQNELRQISRYTSQGGEND